MLILFILLITFWAVSALVLDSPPLDEFNKFSGEYFKQHSDDQQANQDFLKRMRKARTKARKKTVKKKSLRKGLKTMRRFTDSLSKNLSTESQIIPITTGNLDAEWIIAPNANSKHRVLYVHGGAFMLGSTNSHRQLADQFSHIADAAVLLINYRKLPEHSRRAGIRDVQNAYRWILENGPEGKSACDFLIVAGDSAGGNFALMLSSWSVNTPRRPDAVIALSPLTDGTLSSSSIRDNFETDFVLKQGFKALLALPRNLLLWLVFLAFQIKPSNPLVSPVLYNLDNLPPTLIHASDSEMLFLDAVRYANKANAAGSKVKLQVWQQQLHGWHLFNFGRGSANAAWQEVSKFIQQLKS